MSDSTPPAAGEPPVPPVTPSGSPQPPVGGYQSAPPPPSAPDYGQTPPSGYGQTPPPGYGQGAQGAPQGYGQTPPPGYGQQPQAPQQPYYGYQAPAPMNTLAIVTIILAFVFSIAGIVTGHIALKQIDRTGEQGRGLAKAGLILSYVFTGLGVLIVIAYIVIAIIAIAIAGSSAAYTY